MNIERIQEPTSSARFHDSHRELVDLDFFFKDANKFFGRYYLNLGVTPTYDFTKQFDKKLYTNEFIRVVCDWIKTRTCQYSLYFYWDSSRSDTFRDSLVKKLKSTFGFRVWEESGTLDTFIYKIEERDCSTLTGLEVFFSQEKSFKFKNLKKHLEKSGMTYLKDHYFQDLQNKTILFC